MAQVVVVLTAAVVVVQVVVQVDMVEQLVLNQPVLETTAEMADLKMAPKQSPQPQA